MRSGTVEPAERLFKLTIYNYNTHSSRTFIHVRWSSQRNSSFLAVYDHLEEPRKKPNKSGAHKPSENCY